MSLELTARFAVVSPFSTIIGTVKFCVVWPSDTPLRLICSLCALETLFNVSVTVLVLLPLTLPTSSASAGSWCHGYLTDGGRLIEEQDYLMRVVALVAALDPGRPGTRLRQRHVIRRQRHGSSVIRRR